MPRAPGRIVADGDRALAEVLVAALRAPATDHEVAESLTHPFHSYPARLHPATARMLVELIAERSRPSALVVDPFCGSGTTLVEARAAGLRAVGTDHVIGFIHDRTDPDSLGFVALANLILKEKFAKSFTCFYSKKIAFLMNRQLVKNFIPAGVLLRASPAHASDIPPRERAKRAAVEQERAAQEAWQLRADAVRARVKGTTQ